MKLEVNYEKCTKSGECYYNHPALFKADGDGLPRLVVDELTTDELKREAEQAVDVCPEQAIVLVEE